MLSIAARRSCEVPPGSTGTRRATATPCRVIVTASPAATFANSSGKCVCAASSPTICGSEELINAPFLKAVLTLVYASPRPWAKLIGAGLIQPAPRWPRPESVNGVKSAAARGVSVPGVVALPSKGLLGGPRDVGHESDCRDAAAAGRLHLRPHLLALGLSLSRRPDRSGQGDCRGRTGRRGWHARRLSGLPRPAPRLLGHDLHL